MRFRKVPPSLIVNSMIIATKAGLKDIATSQMETHHLAHGNLSAVIKALIVAQIYNGWSVVLVKRPLRQE